MQARWPGANEVANRIESGRRTVEPGDSTGDPPSNSRGDESAELRRKDNRMDTDLKTLIQNWDGFGVVSHFDKPTGSWIFICLHDDTLGPCLGGTRMAVYPSPEDGLHDAMRLAEGMTAKWAGIGFDSGGGKAVLAVPDGIDSSGREGLLERYGQLVEALRGLFQTGEDLGTTTEDLLVVSRTTQYVLGFDPETGEKVNPSPYTARGVFSGIRVALARTYRSKNFEGRTGRSMRKTGSGWKSPRK